MSSRGLQFKTINNGGTYKSILHINSADREQVFQKSNDFRINLNHTIKNIFSLKVIKVEMIQSVYPVNQHNNIIYWNDQVGNLVLIQTLLTPGIYTIDELAIEIGTKMTADALDGETYSVTYDTKTKKYTITGTGGLDFTIRTDVSLPNTAYRLIGVEGDTTGNPIIPDRLVDLSYPRNISIKSNLVQSFVDDVFHTNSTKEDRLNPILIVVPMDGQFGDMIAYDPPKIIEYSVKSRALDYILFQLHDEQDNIIDNNGMDWSITIIVESII